MSNFIRKISGSPFELFASKTKTKVILFTNITCFSSRIDVTALVEVFDDI